MSKRFYAVQCGDDMQSDYGSTVYRETRKMATSLHLANPYEEVRIVYCSEDDNYAEKVDVIYQAVEPDSAEALLRMVDSFVQKQGFAIVGVPFEDEYIGWTVLVHDKDGNEFYIFIERGMPKCRTKGDLYWI